MSTAEVFTAERGRLLGIAYNMLGQVADAEDVVQDAYLRWHGLDHATVRNPQAMLTTIVTRLAIDRLRSAQHQRETYIGPWLPEPIDASTDLADRVVDHERVGYALLASLERLNPVERAVLLLRDVFDYDYAEIAEVVERTPANCRQIAVRARERVGDARRRQRPSAREARRLQRAFAWAVQSGDLSRVTKLLADDAICYTDGGPLAPAARKPIYGAVNVAKLFLGLAAKTEHNTAARFITINGDPGYRIDTSEKAISATVLEITDGKIVAIHMMVNPQKLETLGPARRPSVGEQVLLRAFNAAKRRRPSR